MLLWCVCVRVCLCLAVCHSACIGVGACARVCVRRRVVTVEAWHMVGATCWGWCAELGLEVVLQVPSTSLHMRYECAYVERVCVCLCMCARG
jgi:hypothetical protein